MPLMGIITGPARWHRLHLNGRPLCGKVGQVVRRKTFAIVGATYEGVRICRACQRRAA